jgi:hypothetical protein
MHASWLPWQRDCLQQGSGDRAGREHESEKAGTVNSRERLLAVINHEEPDHVPLLCWCFGFTAPEHLRWKQDGRQVEHWYTMRLEHIHTLPEPWDLEQDFRRVKAWLSLGLDDVLEVSVPWSMHPDVTFRDWVEPATVKEPYPLLCREYQTPAGPLRHSVRQTGEQVAPGWVVQPDRLPLIEDYNIPRGVKHAVVDESDLPKVRYLLQGPNGEQLAAYRERMALVRRFAAEQEVLVQGWSAFGMDGVIWLMGVERAILAGMTEPEFFQELVDAVFTWDQARTNVMLDVGGVDLVVQRGWYSSIEFWSPRLFRRFVLPHLTEMASLAHQAGAKFAYTMTMGVLPLLGELLDAGIDLLYYVDPVQDNADLSEVKKGTAGKIAIAGGINSGVTLGRGSSTEIRQAARHAVEALAPGGNFILAPVDALFPDTPWESVLAMIEAWREVRGY